MQTRTRDRLKALEAKLAPKGRHFVFVSFDAGGPGAPSRDEQLASFKAENGVTPSDQIHEVMFVRCDEPSLRPRADQIAAFKAENGVTPNDTVHEVSVAFS
jgi:hypothetical protein